MSDDEADGARLWARHPTFRRKMDAAREIVRRGLSECRRPYVAFSCGKDSAVLLHLVMEQAPETPARIIVWPETPLLIPDVDAVIAAWRERGADIEMLRLTRASLADSVVDRWHLLHEMADADGVFIGLRADESRSRRITLRVHGAVFHPMGGPVRVCPLAWLTTTDVAAHIVANDLPTLAVYREHGFAERTTTRVPRESVRDGVLADMRERNPAAYARLRMIYPGEA